MPRRTFPTRTVVAVQAASFVLVAAAAGLWLARGDTTAALPEWEPPRLPADRRVAHQIGPLYDDPEVVSDEELAAVLAKVLPRFSQDDMQPNYIEHALRTWGVDAVFDESDVLSGAAMRDFLLEHRRQVEVFGTESPPLLIDRPRGVGIRWEQPYDPRASAHHDHLLASLSEAGVPLDQPVAPPTGRQMTFRDVLEEALRDLRLDEVEAEWSVMAFALWFTPDITEMRSGDGRRITFDLLARRLMRSQKNLGVCSGTHRVYTLVVLWRLNEEFDRSILSEPVRQEVWEYLERVRDLIVAAQFPDGRWPSNWADGRRAVTDPIHDEEHRQVIATGHHLEWLSIAPVELHPPREQILRAADWIIALTTSKRDEDIRRQYTFYSHVGNALAMWRGTRPAEFWAQRRTPAGDRPAVPAVPPLPAAGAPPAPSAPADGLLPPEPSR